MTLTDSKIARDTYHEQLPEKRCGTCRWKWARDFIAHGGRAKTWLECWKSGDPVKEHGYCDVWKKGKSDD